MRTPILFLVASLVCSGGKPSLSAPPDERRGDLIVKTGMQFDDARRSLEAINARKTEYDEARGFMRRKPSDPLPPKVHLYMLDDKVRLEIFVASDSNVIQTMVIRFEPEVLASIKANYFEALCYAVTFHQDDSYSLRLMKNAELNKSIEAK